MKNYLKLFYVIMLMIVSASQAFAQIKDGEATVVQGNTTTVSIGSAYQATLNRATGISYTWSAASSAISIQSKTNKTCTIKGNTPGTTKLNYQCSYYIDGYRRTMNFYYDITVKSNTIAVTRIAMSPTSATMEIGESLQLTATVYPTNATNKNINWTTEHYDIASVSNSGLVTARSAGRVWIWARAEDGSGAGNYCVIDVNEPVKVASIDLSESEKTLTVGETFELTATVLPDNAFNKGLIWSSDNEQIATVENGVVMAVSPGECDIVCKSSDGSNVSATCHISVQQLQQYWLSVVVPNGVFAINVTDLEHVSVKITPDEGYIINSVTLDGEYQSNENGEINLPKLTRDATLNIVFASETVTGIETVDNDDAVLKVAVRDHSVIVNGLPANQEIQIYNTNGVLIKTTTDNMFDLPQSGIYILLIDRRSFKLAIQ